MGLGYDLTAWKQRGQICLWCFDVVPHHKHAGWHFSGDREGCASLVALLFVLAQLRQPAFRTLKLADPTVTSRVVEGGKHRAMFWGKFRLRSTQTTKMRTKSQQRIRSLP
jgi:hypothetical protein